MSVTRFLFSWIAAIKHTIKTPGVSYEVFQRKREGKEREYIGIKLRKYKITQGIEILMAKCGIILNKISDARRIGGFFLPGFCLTEKLLFFQQFCWLSGMLAVSSLRFSYLSSIQPTIWDPAYLYCLHINKGIRVSTNG